MDTSFEPATDDENEIVIEAWSTVLFEKFSRFKHLLVEGLAVHSDEAFRRHPHPAGSRVLDIGCGFGDSTRFIANRVGQNGEAVGVDCSEPFIESAEREASEHAVENARFFVADVQIDDLRGPYDYAFSRFGTMFFLSPGAALRNVRKALAPGGKLTMIVWRRREENPWLHEAELCVKAIVPEVKHEDTDAVHCGPGPFSMAGPDFVSNLLRGAGFDHVVFERFDADICIGSDLSEAIEFAIDLGPAGEAMRLAGAEAERLKPVVEKAVGEALARYERADGVWAPSSTWFVTAHNG